MTLTEQKCPFGFLDIFSTLSLSLHSPLSLSPLSGSPRRRHYSILAGDYKTPLTNKEKTRASLSLLKTESNPDLRLGLSYSRNPDHIVFSRSPSPSREVNKHFLPGYFQIDFDAALLLPIFYLIVYLHQSST